MSLDSFYGGRPGADFVIKRSFTSIAEMKAAFELGADYTEVWYGEYCLIDTINKNDHDNGKIFRRGLDYQNAVTHGAEYIGQIVGPSSGTPLFYLGTIDEVRKQADIDAVDGNAYLQYPTAAEFDEETGKLLGVTITDGANHEPLYDNLPFSFKNSQSLVPGKEIDDEGNVKYRDEITYTWCNIKTNDKDSESWFYVGFEWPYLVTDYDVHTISPYKNHIYQDQIADIERVDDMEHPFYSRWDIGIPRGVKGDTLRNLRIIIPTEADKDSIYDARDLVPDPESGKVIKPETAGYDGMEEDIEQENKILVLDYYIYDDLDIPQPIMVYIGDYDVVEEVDVNEEDGTITIKYSHSEDRVEEAKLRLIKEAHISHDGVLTFTTNVIDPETGEHEKYVVFDDDAQDTFHLKYVDDVRFLQGIDEDKHLQVKYNTSDEYVQIGDPINYIADVQVRYTDYHLLVLFSEPTMRATAADLIDGKDALGHMWANNVESLAYPASEDLYWRDFGSVKDANGIMIGLNVKDQDAIDWGFDLYNETKGGIYNYLMARYPKGLTDEINGPTGELKGKVVCYGEADEQKIFYAFDYDHNEWFYLGDLTDDGIRCSILTDASTPVEEHEASHKLHPDGLMFKRTGDEGPFSTVSVPRYWDPMYSEV